MATKRTPAPGDADKLIATKPGCSRHRASLRTITGSPNKAAPLGGR
jgi:hypothetical protein